MNELMLGDCLKILPTLADGSVDSIVTDPPYGLAFMGKKWDYDVPSTEIWKECLRVLKPGGHLLAFGGTRTYHRLVVAIEDAGFEIRDQIQWIYGQGFPKSTDISKQIDKAAGAEREDLGPSPYANKGRTPTHNSMSGAGTESTNERVTAPATPDAQKWSGWGTALKPANEPICLARKPCSEKTVASNVLKHGTGGLNIDGTRITAGDDLKPVFSGAKGAKQAEYGDGTVFGNSDKYESIVSPLGRFPSNVILDEDAAEVLDAQAGPKPGPWGGNSKKSKNGETSMFGIGGNVENERFKDGSNVSRFFYVAKASKSDRGEGNIHPTVKPINLMEYLIKLVTPEGGIVLDPFMGSGTTGAAAQRLGFDFIGIEMNPDYFKIAEVRNAR